MQKRLSILFSLAVCLLTVNFMAAQTVGPSNGSLVIVGGNAKISPEIFKKFIDLAGGPSAKIVIIPTANGSRDFGPAYQTGPFSRFEQHGATNLSLLHTDDREEADSPAFAKAINEADGVWFLGGRQWRLADSYLGTATEKAFWDLLDRGGVIGGSSAGATIQGSYLARGDTKTNTIMMGDHVEGFGFLKKSAIDQHLLRRNRQFDLVEIMEAHPDLLGIGLDEGTAIIVRGDQFTVLGASFVAIYDPNVMTAKTPFYLMHNGDRFDLVKRKAFRSGVRWNDLEMPRD